MSVNQPFLNRYGIFFTYGSALIALLLSLATIAHYFIAGPEKYLFAFKFVASKLALGSLFVVQTPFTVLITTIFTFVMVAYLFSLLIAGLRWLFDKSTSAFSDKVPEDKLNQYGESIKLLRKMFEKIHEACIDFLAEKKIKISGLHDTSNESDEVTYLTNLSENILSCLTKLKESIKTDDNSLDKMELKYLLMLIMGDKAASNLLEGKNFTVLGLIIASQDKLKTLLAGFGLKDIMMDTKNNNQFGKQVVGYSLQDQVNELNDKIKNDKKDLNDKNIKSKVTIKKLKYQFKNVRQWKSFEIKKMLIKTVRSIFGIFKLLKIKVTNKKKDWDTKDSSFIKQYFLALLTQYNMYYNKNEFTKSPDENNENKEQTEKQNSEKATYNTIRITLDELIECCLDKKPDLHKTLVEDNNKSNEEIQKQGFKKRTLSQYLTEMNYSSPVDFSSTYKSEHSTLYEIVNVATEHLKLAPKSKKK